MLGHLAKTTLQKLTDLGWETLTHSPDLSPTTIFLNIRTFFTPPHKKNQFQRKSSSCISWHKNFYFYCTGINNLVN